MPRTTYREATPADAAAIRELLHEIMADHGVQTPAPEKLAPVVDAAIASADHTFLVATADDSLIGMCALIFSLSTWSAAPVCELQDVIVTHTARRTQVGKGLLHAAERLAKQRGCERLFLLAEPWNLAARAFYRDFGFSEKTCSYFERDLLVQ
ncbi:MAG TPA: GNAT family N-acetyltransferase [Thermoleophilia bacterium]